MRTSEVRYPGTAEEGPFEQHDLSAFCSSEDHAVKVGTYILSKRRHVTHRLQIGVKPDAFNPTLTAGDLVRVRLDRIASTGAAGRHDYLYEVDQIGKSVTGDVQLDLTHFPIDGNLASVVAQEVNDATGGGLILPTGLTGITCDINSSSDSSVPADTSSGNGDIPDESLFETQVSEIQPMDTSAQVDEDDDEDGNGVELSEAAKRYWYGGWSGSNPKDALSGQTGSAPSGSGNYTYSGDPDNPKVGDTVTAPEICEGGQVTFYRLDPTVPGGKVIAAQATSTYTMVINDVDKSVYAEVSCPDPSSPTGYGDPIQLGPTPIIKDPNVFEYVSNNAFSIEFDYKRIVVEPPTKLCSNNGAVGAGGTFQNTYKFTSTGKFGFKYTLATVTGSITCAPSSSNPANWIRIDVRNTANGEWVQAQVQTANSGANGGGGFIYTDGNIVTNGEAVLLKINNVSVPLP
jgi:hypothetical protein